MSELSKHLIVKTDPIRDTKYVIEKDGFRISVLTDSLIRVEVSANGFIDSATQEVWFRNFASPVFEKEETETEVIIKTQKITFKYSTVSKKRIIIFPDGREVLVNNEGNLLGTARTLDMKIDKVTLDQGIISTTGVALLNDRSLLLGEDGFVHERPKNVTDEYIFAYDKDYRRALKDFFQLTGEVPLIPRYALGNWWSRYKAYTQDEYVTLMKRFIKEEIPLSVATIDMDWHWVDVKDKLTEKEKHLNFLQGPGWTGYSWNTDLFPDYKKFLKWLHEKDLKVTVNLHPALGIRSFEDMYEDMAKELGIDPSTKQTIPFDIADKDFINAYFKIIHKPYERDGVDFWWIDWQQGSSSKLKGLDPLWSLNHYHYLDSMHLDAEDKRGLILSRYAGPGSHRYPLGFSGDSFMKWRSLVFQPYFTANASNIGFTWWSHDIGGHHLGEKDDEMYLRWLQLGVFSPINRLHSTAHELLGKEPWKCRQDVFHSSKEYLRLRHELVPYLYSANVDTHKCGKALVEPIYYRFPEKEEAYTVRNQFFFGPSLMVCPITEKVNPKTSLASVKAWIPEGRWTDIRTGFVYEKEGYKVLNRDINDIPVLAKEGTILPLAKSNKNGVALPENLDVLVYRGNGFYELLEDDGIHLDYNQKYCVTEFEIKEDEKAKSYIFNMKPVIGTTELLPEQRKYNFIFKDIVKANVTVKVNGEILKQEVLEDEIKVSLDNLSYQDNVEIELNHYEVLKNPNYKEYLVELLTKVQGNNLKKIISFNTLRHWDEPNLFIKSIALSGFPKQISDAIEEII